MGKACGKEGVVELIEGNDGNARVAKVRCGDKIVTRAIQMTLSARNKSQLRIRLHRGKRVE